MKPKTPLSKADREFLDFCYVGLVTWHWRRRDQAFDIDDLEACMRSMPDEYLIDQIQKTDVMRHPETGESYVWEMLNDGGFEYFSYILCSDFDDPTTVLIYPDSWMDAIDSIAEAA